MFRKCANSLDYECTLSNSSTCHVFFLQFTTSWSERLLMFKCFNQQDSAPPDDVIIQIPSLGLMKYEEKILEKKQKKIVHDQTFILDGKIAYKNSYLHIFNSHLE